MMKSMIMENGVTFKELLDSNGYDLELKTKYW